MHSLSVVSHRYGPLYGLRYGHVRDETDEVGPEEGPVVGDYALVLHGDEVQGPVQIESLEATSWVKRFKFSTTAT